MYHRNPFFNLVIWFATGFGTWGKNFRHENNLLRQTHAQIIDAVADKEKLQLQIKQLQSEMLVQRQNQELEMNKQRAAWQIQTESERAKFNLEREQATLKEKFELEQAIKRAELKSEETLTLKKLDFEQKIKQAELNSERSILSVKEQFANKETQLHQKLHAEMYDKLNAALVQMTQEGDKNTKFVHGLMMKIFDKAPALNSFQLTQRQYQGEPENQPLAVEVENT